MSRKYTSLHDIFFILADGIIEPLLFIIIIINFNHRLSDFESSSCNLLKKNWEQGTKCY